MEPFDEKKKQEILEQYIKDTGFQPYLIKRSKHNPDIVLVMEKPITAYSLQQEQKHKNKMIRAKDMIAMRRRGVSLTVIGKKYGVSRERVRQILVKFSEPEDWAYYPRQKVSVFVKRMCPVCSTVFTVKAHEDKKYCSFKCSGWARAKYKTLEEKRLGKNMNNKRKWTDPEYRRSRLDYYRNWRNKRETENPELRTKRLLQMKGFNQKRKKRQ